MIEIVTEKLVERGVKMRKILSIKGVTDYYDGLPEEYLKGYPRVQKDPDTLEKLAILGGAEDLCTVVYSFSIGTAYCEDYFRAALKVMRAAGDRLRRLRQKEEELKKTWKGEEVFFV